MRLIDADKISPQWKTTATGTDTEAHKTYTYWHRVIDEAPTVEAIPIEWIRNYIEKQKKGLRLHDDFNDLDEIWGIIGIETLLDEWEADNE